MVLRVEKMTGVVDFKLRFITILLHDGDNFFERSTGIGVAMDCACAAGSLIRIRYLPEEDT
jgi:hypothetical protein